MQLHTGAIGYMDKLLLSLQQRLIGNVINLRPVHLFYAKKRQNKCSW